MKVQVSSDFAFETDGFIALRYVAQFSPFTQTVWYSVEGLLQTGDWVELRDFWGDGAHDKAIEMVGMFMEGNDEA